jgi:hypothetical protein
MAFTVIVGASLVPTLVTVINTASTDLRSSISGSASQTGVSLTNSSNTTLAIRSTYSDAVCSDLAIVNATGGEAVVASGNYTFVGADCNFIFADASPYVGETGNLTHDYTATVLNGTSSSSASLLELTILFFALGVMIAGVGTSVSGLVEYGLI